MNLEEFDELESKRKELEERIEGIPGITSIVIAAVPSESEKFILKVNFDTYINALPQGAEIIPEEIGGIPVRISQESYEVDERLIDVSGAEERNSIFTSVPEREAHFSRIVDPLANFDFSLLRDIVQSVVQPGRSISGALSTSGTIGAIVVNTSGDPFILSNWHVLRGTLGKDDNLVLQPGSSDGGTPDNAVVGRLTDSFLDADGDAAISSIHTGIPQETSILGEEFGYAGISRILPGQSVQKNGRTTQRTRGIVTEAGIYYVPYFLMGVKEIYAYKITNDPAFPDNPISDNGDSGSVWYTREEHDAVGLHFAGGRSLNGEAFSLASNIERILERFNCQLVKS